MRTSSSASPRKTGTTMPDDAPLPVAVCAPGHRAAAALILAVKGEEVSEIREHPWLEGYGDVLVFSPSAETAIPFPVMAPAWRVPFWQPFGGPLAYLPGGIA